MKQLGTRKSTRAQVYLNQFYDVVAQNGIVIGSVRYSFHDGEKYCIAIMLANGMPAHGTSMHDMESVFDLIEGEPPWAMPVVQPRREDNHALDAAAYITAPALPAPTASPACPASDDSSTEP